MKIAVFESGKDEFTGMCECGFYTAQWPNEEVAGERIRQHRREHQTGEPMEDLTEFRSRLGLILMGGKAVFPEHAVLLDDEGDEG